MHRLSRRMLMLCALVVSALGVSAIGAQAKTSPASAKPKLVIVKSGTTTITASTATVKFLAKNSITPTAIAPAKLSGTSVTLPVKGGVARAKSLDGALLHTGAIKFTVGTKSITLRHITFYKFGKQAHVAAVVAGKVVRIGNITGLKAVVNGKDVTLSGELHLTAVVAHVINTLAGKHVVSAGYDFGSFSSALVLK